MAASLAGVPQWYQARGPIIWQTVSTSFGESSFVQMGGLDQGGTSAPSWYFGALASHIITGGPTSTDPIMVQENGVVAAVKFNQSTKFPDWVNQALVSASYNVT